MMSAPVIRLGWALYFFVSLACGLLMVSSQSLWIDEGQTLTFARQRSFSSWIAELLSNRKSEAQMPLSMFAAWLGARLVGESEWQLRSLNALWIALAGTAIGRLGQTLRLPILLPLLLVHPFAWYYANEARPYALIICASAWLVYLWGLVYQDGTLSPARLWAIGALSIIGMASSLLFGFALVGFAFAFGATIVTRKIGLDRRHALPIATTVLVMAGLMAYYGWTLTRGASGAKLWSVGMANVTFAFYELLGFGGLGPPRHELREMARGSGGIGAVMLQGCYIVGLGILGASYMALVRPLWKLRRDSLYLIDAGAIVFSTGALFAASAVVGFPFWGRHLAFSLPLVVLVIAKAAAAIDSTFLRRLLMVLLLASLLASSLCQRFLLRYGKDDYRSASQMAVAALRSGKNVWWVADHVTAQYYGLGVPANATASGRLIWFNVENERETPGKEAPDLIFLSKPDVHDPRNNVLSYIKEHGYQPIARLTAFRVYARSGSQN